MSENEQKEKILKVIELDSHERYPWYVEKYINGEELEKQKKMLGGKITESSRNELVVLGRELGARKTARELAHKIGDEEWHQGNTKYAFEAYEAACVAPSEILKKAEALLEAEELVKEWEIQIKHLIKGKIRIEQCVSFETRNLLNYANVLIGSCVYCLKDDCSFCSQKKVLNRKYANKVYEALNWHSPEPKERETNRRNSAKHKVLEDHFSKYFLCSSDKPKQEYRAATVAALKLVNRLERVYITDTKE